MWMSRSIYQRTVWVGGVGNKSMLRRGRNLLGLRRE